MRKISTLYVRDPNNRKIVTDEVTPGCEWVLAGEGVATRKYDGTCVMYDAAGWWARREVKAGKEAPRGFILVQEDKETGKQVGWEPVENSGFIKHFREALGYYSENLGYPGYGTFELCGPKVNGNPEKLPGHRLLRHDEAETVDEALIVSNSEELRVAKTRNDLKAMVALLGTERFGWEGVVWHHPNGHMVKLKARDLT